MDGYIKLHRKLLENPVVCKDSDYLSIWIYLLLNATQKKLEIEHQIEQQTSNENRLITILNWDDYQKSELLIEQQVNNERTTSEQQVNTNKNVKNVRNINKEIRTEYEKRYSNESFEFKCVRYLVKSITDEMPSAKVPASDEQIDKWCDNIEKMVRLDKRSQDEIYSTLVYARTDDFWKANIRSTSKFREKYETLYLQMKKKKEKPNQQVSRPVKVNKFNDFPQRSYDMESLERQILGGR